MPLYAYIAKLAGKPTDKFVLPVPFFNIINGEGGGLTQQCLGNGQVCWGVILDPTVGYRVVPDPYLILPLVYSLTGTFTITPVYCRRRRARLQRAGVPGVYDLPGGRHLLSGGHAHG